MPWLCKTNMQVMKLTLKSFISISKVVINKVRFVLIYFHQFSMRQVSQNTI